MKESEVRGSFVPLGTRGQGCEARACDLMTEPTWGPEWEERAPPAGVEEEIRDAAADPPGDLADCKKCMELRLLSEVRQSPTCLDGDVSQINRRWPLKNKTVDKECLRTPGCLWLACFGASSSSALGLFQPSLPQSWHLLGRFSRMM